MSLNLLLIPLSVLAGILTILAPCTLPIIPAVLGAGSKSKKSLLTALTSLSVSILIFSIFIKSSAWFISLPSIYIRAFSFTLILYFALNFLIPGNRLLLSTKIAIASIGNKIFRASRKELSGGKSDSLISDILLGIALGPIFQSCSPIFALVLAVVIVNNFYYGLLLLLIYVFSLSITLYLLAQKGVDWLSSLSFMSNRKLSIVIGLLLAILAIFILFGWDKKIDKYLITLPTVQFFTRIEYDLLPNI